MVRLLLCHGADANICLDQIEVGCITEHLESRIIIERGGTWDRSVPLHEISPLHVAARRHNVELVRLLSCHVPVETAYSALLFAVGDYDSPMEIVRVLVDVVLPHKDDPKIQSSFGQFAVFFGDYHTTYQKLMNVKLLSCIYLKTELTTTRYFRSLKCHCFTLLQ